MQAYDAELMAALGTAVLEPLCSAIEAMLRLQVHAYLGNTSSARAWEAAGNSQSHQAFLSLPPIRLLNETFHIRWSMFHLTPTRSPPFPFPTPQSSSCF